MRGTTKLHGSALRLRAAGLNSAHVSVQMSHYISCGLSYLCFIYSVCVCIWCALCLQAGLFFLLALRCLVVCWLNTINHSVFYSWTVTDPMKCLKKAQISTMRIKYVYCNSLTSYPPFQVSWALSLIWHQWDVVVHIRLQDNHPNYNFSSDSSVHKAALLKEVKQNQVCVEAEPESADYVLLSLFL